MKQGRLLVVLTVADLVLVKGCVTFSAWLAESVSENPKTEG